MALIRPAEKADVSAIHQLGKNIAEFSVNEQTVNFWPVETLHTAVSSNDVVLLVAEVDSSVIGFILATYTTGLRKATIENILVDPAHRGNQTGAQLLNALIEALDVRGCDYVATLIPQSAANASNVYLDAGFNRGNTFMWLDRSLNPTFKRLG